MSKYLRFIKPNDRVLYSNCDIPARLFFDNLIQGDLSVLGQAPIEKLEKASLLILDEYCELDNNIAAIKWFKKQASLMTLKTSIVLISNILHIIEYLCRTEYQYKQAIELINSIEHTKIDFKIDKPLMDEISRVKSSVLGVLLNRLKMEEGAEKNQTDSLKKDFLRRLVAVENCLGRGLDEDVSLRKFIYLEKAAVEKAKNLKA